MALRSTESVRPILRTLTTIAAAALLTACGASSPRTGGDYSHQPNPTYTRQATEADYARAEKESMPMMDSADDAGGVASGAAMPTGGPASMPAPKDIQTGEDYTDYGHNPATDTKEDNLSTFAIDVDTASYTIARRKILQDGGRPPASAVRVEEFVNFFRYDYATPDGGQPFAVHVDGAPSPFVDGELMLRVGIQGKVVSNEDRKPMNLTFLVDVSGSMGSDDKLGLAKEALKLLVQQLDHRDHISLVTYAGQTSVVLPATNVVEDNLDTIISGIDALGAGGSTAMSSGLTLAYEQAMAGKGRNTTNRVVVLSDGDANVGQTEHGSMLDSIRHYVDHENITMTSVGLGMGNYQDTRMEQLANQGNGNYYYIDTREQAKRVFVDDFGGTMEVIAKDVKIQVEFDADAVKSYRLLGYENRDIADEDFRNDKVDAGEIGAGHTVTALYAITLEKEADRNTSLGLVRVRHKRADADLDEAALETVRDMHISNVAASFDAASPDLRFATAVVGFAEHLRNGPGAEAWTLSEIRDVAITATLEDRDREEFVAMLDSVIGQE